MRVEAVVLRSLGRCAHSRNRVGQSPPASLPPRPEFQAVFIFDVHVGMGASQLSRLCEFLEHNSAATLYLVGDIVDFWPLRRRMGKDRGGRAAAVGHSWAPELDELERV